MSLSTELSDLLENRIKNELEKKQIIIFYPESRIGSYIHFRSIAIKNMKYGSAYHYSTYYEGLMKIHFFVTYSGNLYSWLCSNKNLNHCFIYEGNISDYLLKNKSS
jgi:hypothetical protein